MQNLSLKICFVIVALFGSVGGGFASDFPPCTDSAKIQNNCFLSYTYPSGNEYVGEWKDDKFHGQGTFTNTDGTKDEGKWNNNELVKQFNSINVCLADSHKLVDSRITNLVEAKKFC